jgi:parallel beta-helix repeat protein
MKEKLTASLLILTLIIGISSFITQEVSISASSEIDEKSAGTLAPLQTDPTTIYVDDNGTGFTKIQDAINEAKSGDTIYVYNGTYYENVVVNKNDLRIIGENKSNTVIDGKGTLTVVNVETDYVVIANFTIQNSGGTVEDSGICLSSNNNTTVDNNVILDCIRGIWLYKSDDNNLTHNNISNNDYAIYLRESDNNTLKNNIVENNNCGIYLAGSSGNSIYHNKFVNNIKQTDVDGLKKNIWNYSYPSGGNYWSDYNGTDPDGDGIGNSPYNITDEEIDWLPRLLTVRNVDTKFDYFWIQEAIDAVETKDGHTIRVNASIYFENVRVYKSVTLYPRGNQTTATIDGEGSGEVLHIVTSNVGVSNFTIRNGEYGIHLDRSGGSVLRNCNMTNNKYNFFVTGTELSHFINDVDDSNLVDGKRIYYRVNNHSQIIDGLDLGYLGLVNCTGMTVRNLSLMRNGQGLLLAFTNSSTITRVNASNNFQGIDLFKCSRDTITRNNIMNNKNISINVDDSVNNNITDNKITGKNCVYLSRSFGNNVDGNNITGNKESLFFGIRLFYSEDNTIAGNVVTNNSRGVKLDYCQGNNVSFNNVIDNYIGILSETSSNNRLIANNVTNNYYGNYLLHSSDNNVTENNINRNQEGVYLFFSNNNSIARNSITRNGNGIKLDSSDKNTIIENLIENNSVAGIDFSRSSNNRIYHNSFINNTATAFYPQKNFWNASYPSGGNYWNLTEYTDEKRGPKQDLPGSDGINDFNYTVKGKDNVDFLPLTKPYCGEHDIGIKIVARWLTLLKSSETSYDFTMKVINYGVHDETGINMTVYVRNATRTYSEFLGNVTFNLGYRNSRIFNFTWDITGFVKGVYTIETNLTSVTGETCLTDNVFPRNYTILLTGDISFDGVVDIEDLVLVIKYFGSYPSHPKWNPNADIIDYGKVDIQDLVLVIKHLEEHYP